MFPQGTHTNSCHTQEKQIFKEEMCQYEPCVALHVVSSTNKKLVGN